MKRLRKVYKAIDDHPRIRKIAKNSTFRAKRNKYLNPH